MNEVRVLIIDEHTEVCRALALRLQTVPTIDVVGATCNFEEGTCLARLAQPDVILLELKSSGRCGHSGSRMDPVRAIRRLLDAGRCSIIVLTSYLDEAEHDTALFAGAKRYLLKNIDTIRLVTEIEEVACEAMSHEE